MKNRLLFCFLFFLSCSAIANSSKNMSVTNYINESSKDGNSTSVESDYATYNGKEIHLKGHIVIANAIGQLTAENAILIRDEEGKYSIDFPWIELSKEVTLQLSSGKSLQCHHLNLNFAAMTSHFFGNPSIYFHDEMGTIVANRAQVDYEEVEGNIEPVKVILTGNVRMVNEREQDQYALADYVTYFPNEEYMIMEGNEGRPVLFYDRIKEIQLSAQKVLAYRNTETGKESVQGVGDVRCLFSQNEFEKLTKTFRWE